MSKLLVKLLSNYALRAGDGEKGSEGDVARTEDGDVIGNGGDARVAMLNSIADQADRDRAEELNDVNDDGSTSQFSAPDPKTEIDAEAAAADEAHATEQARQAAEAAANAAPVPKIKVNGEEVELTPEMIAHAQKVVAADAYLAEAKAKAAQPAAPAATPNKPAPAQQPAEVDYVALARALQMGTEEEAAERLRQLHKAGPSQDDIARTIDERLAFNTALSTFSSEYRDLMGDPVLRKMVQEKDAELLRQGDSRPYLERYKAIGDEVRGWLSSKAPAPAAAAPVDTPAADKVARKAAAAPVPKAATARAQSSVEEEKEESAQSVIADMARSRGGPQWMRGMSS